MGYVGDNSCGRGTSTGLAPKDCLFYVGPDPGGAGSVKRLLGELALKIHSSQNSQGLPHTSSKKETETVKENSKKIHMYAIVNRELRRILRGPCLWSDE